MRLLVTRPAPDGERTAALLRERGHQVIVAPVLRIEAVPADLKSGPWAALIVTSSNAVRAIATHPRRAELLALPLFTVGRRSAEAARAAGFSDVTSADGDVGALARLVAARLAGVRTPLLYLAGEDRAGDFAAALAPLGLKVETAVVYRAVPALDFSQWLEAAVATGRLDGVLHYSRRSAEAFLAGAKGVHLMQAVRETAHYCLSQEVAAPLAAGGMKIVKIAPRPDETALLALLSLPS